MTNYAIKIIHSIIKYSLQIFAFYIVEAFIASFLNH